MTKHAASRLITVVLMVALAVLLRRAAHLRRENALLISASEVYREAAARRNGTMH